jgi:hypothetical protein
VAIRYNCQRTCNSCRTQEVIDLDAEAGQASGLSQEAGSPDEDGTREVVSPGDESESDHTAKVVTAVLASVLAVAVLGAAYLLNSRRASRQFDREKTIAAVDLGWDNSAEVPLESKRATVWHQQGSIGGTYLDVQPGTQRGAHFYPAGMMGAFEPAHLGNSLAQVPPAPQQPAGPAKFYPLSSRLNR